MAGDRLRVAGARELVPAIPLLAFLVAFAVGPVVLLLANGIGPLGGERLVLATSDPLNRIALENSLVQGSLGAVGATFLGYPVGILLGRYRWRGRSALRAALLVPFLLPSIVMVLGVEQLFSSGGVGRWIPILQPFGSGLLGIVVVNTVYNAPLVALLTAVGVEASSPELEEASATLGGGAWPRFRDVWGPPSLVGAAAGALLAFLFGALAFAAPILLCPAARCYTLEARVWELDQLLLSPGAAAALTVVTIAAMSVPTVAYLALAGRLRRAPSAGRSIARPLDLHRGGTWLLVAASGVLLALVGGVLASVADSALGASGTAGSFSARLTELFGPKVAAAVGTATSTALANSVTYAALSAAITIVLGVVAGYLFAGRPGSARSLHLFAFVPLLLSPVILSFALYQAWGGVASGNNVWMLIVLSQASLALPLVLQSLHSSLARVPANLRDAATVLGSRPFAAYLDVQLPMARASVVTAALFAAALGLGEFTATNFLATPTTTTLSVELYRLESLRLLGPAAALALVLVVVSFAVFASIGAAGEHVSL